MKKGKKQLQKSFFFRSLIILNTIFLFKINVEQVSANELANDFEAIIQTEKSSESSDYSEEVSADEDTAEVEKAVKKDAAEEFLDESIDDNNLDPNELEEEKDDLVEKNEQGSDDFNENSVDDSSEKEEEDVVDTKEDESLDSKEVDDKELADMNEIEESEEEAEEPEAVEEAEESKEEVEESEKTEFEEQAATLQQKSTEKNKVEVDRIAGQNRYKNAVEISKSGWNSSATVILTNGEKFADSLTGSPLASLHNAPILLTKASSLPNETLAEIKRLKAKKVIVLGGELSVTNAVLNTLNKNGFSTRRISGQNRYLLAENIAKEVMAEKGKNRDAFLVSGEAYSDAMSIASVAASKQLPIFLTQKNKLHQTVINAIPDVNSWTIIGGNLTISQKVQNEMEDLGAKTRRLDGRTRYDVNQKIINHYGTSNNQIYIASGEHFSDATPTSVLAARKNSTVLLVKDKNKANLKKQRDFVKAKNIDKLTLIGGTLTLSKDTENYFYNQNYLIYLDPGHGGSDSGANSAGVYEKNLNLSVSKKVRDLLEAKGYTVMMSRMDDSTVSLSTRAQGANKAGSDIFVSIHHNAFNKTSHGIETYYYNEGGKTDNPKANNKNRIQNSKAMAEKIQNELIKKTGAYDRGVKRANFHVVRETQMPSVLIEAGFIDNAAERAKLVLSSYQQKLAVAISSGIENFRCLIKINS